MNQNYCQKPLESLEGKNPRKKALLVEQTGNLVEDLKNNFWANVKKSEKCWEWTGSFSGTYGKIKFGYKSYLAHRVAWELTNSAIPLGICVCHKCDNTKCVRPDHLFLGTLSDNSKDCWSKGRNAFQKSSFVAPRGENVKISRLKPEDIRSIRKLWNEGLNQVQISKLFQVSQPNIGMIVRGDTWKHIV